MCGKTSIIDYQNQLAKLLLSLYRFYMDVNLICPVSSLSSKYLCSFDNAVKNLLDRAEAKQHFLVQQKDSLCRTCPELRELVFPFERPCIPSPRGVGVVLGWHILSQHCFRYLRSKDSDRESNSLPASNDSDLAM
jgi:hypothetical protein